jgi:hypothetical protein
MAVAGLSFECLILSALSLLMTAYSLQPTHSATQRTSGSFALGREQHRCARAQGGMHKWHNDVKP